MLPHSLLIKSHLNLSSFIVLLLLLLCFTASAQGAINISYSDITVTASSQGTPTISCEVRAEQDGMPFAINTSNAKIIQSKTISITNFSISPPGPTGTQTLTWGLEIAPPHNISFELMVSAMSANPEIGYIQLPVDLSDFLGYDAIVYEVDLNNNEKVFLDKIDLTQYNTKQFYFVVQGNYVPDARFAAAPYIDSITFTNPNMSYIWTGTGTDMTGMPPKRAQLGTPYMITLRYDEPAGHPYIREWMIVHFAGGIKYKVEIVAHEFDIENKPLLKLLTPKGDEKFAPCQEVLIEWTGQNPNYAVKIEFSSTGTQSYSWELVRYVPGNLSSYLWTVPQTISDNCYIRISQEFSKDAFKPLSSDSAAINSATFDDINTNTATRLLTASSMNNIIEWDLFSTSVVTRMTEIHTADNTQITSAIYIDNNRFVALDRLNKTLLYYNSGDNTLQKSQPLSLPPTFVPYSMYCDSKQRFILLTANEEYSNTLVFIDTTGNYIASIVESLPITSAYLSEFDDRIYYSLIDNTIKSVSTSNLPNLSNADQYDFAKNYAIINAISVSKDGNMIGAVHRKLPNSPQNTFADNTIFDKRINKIYKNLHFNAEHGFTLDFSPASTIAIIACYSGVQVSLYDITNRDNWSYVHNLSSTFRGLTVSKTGNLIAGFAEGRYNIFIASFAMPEQTANSTPFAIVQPSLSVATPELLHLDNMLIGETDTFTLDMQLCNNGLSVIELTELSLLYGWYFYVDKANTMLPITLAPNDCVTISFVVNPRDTGMLTDSFRLTYCDFEYSFPLSVYSINRKLTSLVGDTIDFGEACLNDTNTLRLELFRNDDDVDVVINNIVSNNGAFIIESFARDTILHPGEVYVAEISFAPNVNIDLHTARFMVYYANQGNVLFDLYGKGTAIELKYELSHDYLPFMPEEPTREFTFTNTGTFDIIIDSISFEPKGLYINDKGTGVVGPGASNTFSVTCSNAPNITPARMILHSNVCNNREIVVNLVQYSATVELTLPALVADPRNEDFMIPIYFSQKENYPYGGTRSLEVSFSFNASLFYPTHTTSTHNNVSIVSNSIDNNNIRHIKLELSDEFVGSDSILCWVHGVAALGYTDSTALMWDRSSAVFSSKVITTKFNDGSLTIDICEDRLLVVDGLNVILFKNLAPNPANDFVEMFYELISFEANNIADVQLCDLSGSPVWQKSISLKVGKHSEIFDVTGLATGTYIFRIDYNGKAFAKILIKI